VAANKSTSKNAAYTYRCGAKLKLKKRPDQFVVRRLPDDLPTEMGAAVQMSTSSARVTCATGDLENLMAEARKLAPTHHAYETDNTGGDFLITDRVIVTCKQALDTEAVGIFAAKYALEIIERISDRDYLFRLTDSTGMNPVKLVVKLTEQEDLVANIDHDLNMVFNKRAVQLAMDPSYQDQWHLHRRRPASDDYDPRASANCEIAWQLLDSFGNHDVVVSVADDGCQLDHPDFDSPGKFAGWGYFPGTSFTLKRRGDSGADPDEMHHAGENHGTACAGVIAAETDGELTVGAAPECRLLPIKWPTSGPSLFVGDTRMRRVLDYIGDKADVMSNSWGSSPTSSWAATTLSRIDPLARNGGRRGKGIVFLWAAGNENCPISHTANVDVPFTSGIDFSTSLPTWVGVQTSRTFSHDLAGRDGVMHVAALASTAQRSHYSNYGTDIALCAPSSNSHTYRRLVLPGLGITTTRGGDAVRDNFGGTSSATPLVAGIVALVISPNPELTSLEIVSLLKRTASKDLNMTGWPQTPPASFDPDSTTSWDVSPIAPFDSGAFADEGFPEGTWSPWFGHGKIDAVAAVREALALADNRTVRVSGSRAANLNIPDRDAAGVVSRLVINDHGRIQSLKASVDITHTWIGDLIVRLVGPGGQRVDLHRRAGNSGRNIVKTYHDVLTPGLAQFQGLDINGVWSLEVSDLASRDTGTLNRWGIESEILTTGELRAESTPSVTIPDNQPNGIQDTIQISDARTIADIEVELDITHSWIGDLTVQVTGPTGAIALLHERGGRDADNIQRTFQIADTASLSNFVGQPANGNWTLSAAGHANRRR
jgi:subtilisin-like proprotein convertase family protein